MNGRELSDELVTYYRGVLQAHALDATSGLCAICHVLRCEDWVDAYDKLAAARKLMSEPHQWDGHLPRWSP